MLYQPNLAKAVGSQLLAKRIQQLRPVAHVFGHTHFNWDSTIDGVRYVQRPLAYPKERRCAAEIPKIFKLSVWCHMRLSLSHCCTQPLLMLVILSKVGSCSVSGHTQNSFAELGCACSVDSLAKIAV